MIGGEAFVITVAMNGRTPGAVHAEEGEAAFAVTDGADGLAEITLRTGENAQVKWCLEFRPE